MKRVLVLLFMLVTTVTFAQESTKKEKVATLEETIQPYVQKLLDGVEKGVAWTSEQVPEVIQQYLLFESASYGLLIVLGFLFLTVLRKHLTNLVLKKSVENPKTGDERSYIKYRKVGTNRWLRYDSDNDADITIEQFAYPFIKFGCYIAGFILVLSNIFDFVKVTFFPKLYLVEKFIQLI